MDRKTLLDQCLRIFRNFHQQLMVIERDTVCQCGACQTASGLTLKFIIHQGDIKEIKVAHFIKATGIDMIVAHRLLKNNISSNEYILITEPCCDAIGHADETDALSWDHTTADYVAVGRINFEYSILTDYRGSIPKPPARERFVAVDGDENLTATINAPLRRVYQTVIDVDKRKDWLLGVDRINRELTSERIGMQHNCQFMGMTLVNTAIDHEFGEERAHYAERVEMPDLNVILTGNYKFKAIAPNQTRLVYNINWLDSPLDDEQKAGMVQGAMANLESLKTFCESMGSA